jgi:hypothetical protein
MRSAREWLEDDTTYATCILALLIDEFGMEFVEWDPATVFMEINREFGFEPSEGLQDRIHAASSLFASNLFHLSLETFSPVCDALSMGLSSSELFMPADLDSVLWGVTEAKLLEGDMFDETPFSHNIARYVGALLDQEGISKPPSVLAFAEYPDGQQEQEQEAFMDDPELFNAYWDNQSTKQEELELQNKRQVLELMQQLRELPIKGAQRNVIEAFIAKLQQDPALTAA